MLKKFLLSCCITLVFISTASATEQLAPYALLINASGYNQDLTLLKQKQIAKNRLSEMSGMIQGETFREWDNDGNIEHGTPLTQIGIDTAGYFHPWVSGLLSIKYDDEFGPKRLSEIMRTSVLLDRAFITIGNLDQSPFYGTIGKRYIAFGQYIDFMVTRPFTRALGRIKAQQLSVSYQHPSETGLYATAFTYNGYSTVRPQQQWGGAIGYAFEFNKIQANIGIDYVSNIADAEGIVFAMGNYPTLAKRVPGIALHTELIIGPITFVAEHIAATTTFDASNISFNNSGAKPSATHTQLAYTFHAGPLLSNLAVGYTHTKEALALAMPQQRFATTYNLLLFKNTILSFEYLYDKEYAENIAAELQGNTLSSEGGHAQRVTAQLAWFF